MTRAPEGFGARLKAEREHRGLALSQIADSTKIPVPLLEALERDDLTRWPKGLYRRAFFRAYISALGLRPEPLAAEFAQRFPDEAALRPAPVGDPVPPVAEARRTPLPLTFATPRDRRYLVARRLAVAVVEFAMIVAAGSLVAVAAGTTVLTASGWVGLLYYPTMSAIRGLQWPSRRRSPKGIRLESWPGRLSSRVWAPLRGASIHACGRVLAHTRSARARAGASWAAAGRLAARQLGRMAGAASACIDLLLLNRANRP